MKILIIRGYGKEQNIENYNSQEIGLAKALVDLGHTVDIAMFSKKKNIKKYITYKGNKIHIIGLNGITFLGQGFYKGLNKLYDNYEFVWSNELNQFASYKLFKSGKKGLAYHGPYIQNTLDFKSIKELFFLLVYWRKKFLSNQIYVKSDLAKKTLNKFGYKNVISIGVGLDVENYSKYKIIRERNEINNFLYIGEFSKRRNTIFLLRVFNKIALTNSQVRLVLIGKGNKKYMKKINSFIRENNLEQNVTIKSSVQNKKLEAFFDSADLFVLPTKYEIFGMVMLEAMYNGVPVITTINGGSVTAIRDCENGYIMDSLNIEEWVERIKHISRDELRNASNETRSTVSEEFTWEHILKKVDSLI
ncbi:glycosyltransferase family 4 protein [Enterococcus casseliflavus]|uniref:glycosyltransferase family 4 protein n=1 Tax=Enterococcus casseliflavus TaxID=37734 RepID=UPI003D0A045D